MIRFAMFSALIVGVMNLGSAALQAQLPVAPMPREVRPDGTFDPLQAGKAQAASEDPAVVVERIIKNSNAVGDKLAKTDAGTDTQQTQGKILSDIDALINQQENPPPPKSDDSKDKDKNNKDKDKNDDPDKNPMGGDMPKDGMPMSGMDEQNKQQPMGGNTRKPRMGDSAGGEKKQPDGSKQAQSKPNDMGGKEQQPESKEPNNSTASGGKPGDKTIGKPSLPFDEEVAKNVWGHLPDKLRQQMTQFYKDDVMPKYSDLLRLYYSSLADKAGSPAPPKK